MKIKKLKIKLNKDNEYSDYRYFIPKSNNIKMTDGRDVDEAVQSLKDKIANLKEQANYLIDKAPLVKYAEGTSITITDCAEAPLRKFSIEGDSYQETRSGRNKADLSGINKSQVSISYVSNEDGSVKVSGTASEDGYIMLKTLAINIPSETYVTMAYGSTKELLKDTDIKAFVWFYDASDNLVGSFNSSTVTMKDKYPTDIVKMTIGVEHMKSGVTYNLDLYIDIEVSETIPTQYEQYGASPSVEYESPIESVGDNINLFDIKTITKNMFTDNATGELKTSSVSSSSDYIKIKANENYVLSYEYETLQNTSNRGIAFYDENKTYLSGINYKSSNKETTIIPEQNGYLRFCYDNNCTNIKICKGTSTLYSPYGQGSIEIKNVNKNILKLYDIAETTRNGLTYSCINGKIKINGTATVLTNIWFNDLDIKMNVGEYTLSSNTNLQGKGSVALKDLNGNIVQTNLNTPAKITLNENRTATQFLLQISSGSTFTNFEMEIQLEKGETATEYIPHQSQTKALYTQQPFRAIGDVKDRFIKQNGLWYEEHKIFRKIFDGTENWLLGAPNYRYYIEINNKAEMSNIDITPLSSRFVCVSGTGIEIDYDTIWLQKLSDSSFRINIFNTNYLSDLANFKKWLTELYNAGTPVYVDYVLEIPTLIPCTAEQVEVLESLQSYDKITYYSVDKTNNVQANIKLIYKQDINAILEGEGV